MVHLHVQEEAKPKWQEVSMMNKELLTKPKHKKGGSRSGDLGGKQTLSDLARMGLVNTKPTWTGIWQGM